MLKKSAFREEMAKNEGNRRKARRNVRREQGKMRNERLEKRQRGKKATTTFPELE